jgi:hypothetical protein
MPRPNDTRRIAFAASLAVLLFIGGGCGNGGRASAPPGAVARTALESALKSWQDGGKPGALAGTDPPVQVLDTHWGMGDRLKSYEILGEETGTAEKQFAVRLVLSKPEKTQEVKYYVIGQGPVMVFRDEDYERNVNMEDGPKVDKAGKRTRRGG